VRSHAPEAELPSAPPPRPRDPPATGSSPEMSAAVPCSTLYSSVSFHLAHPPISLSPGRTGACHGLGSAPPSPENVVRHRFFDHNYRIKLPRLRSTRSRPPQPRLVVGRAERRPWPQDSRAPPAKVADRGRPMPERRRPRTRRRRVNCVPPSKQVYIFRAIPDYESDQTSDDSEDE
uniref:Uncharacterized protein n=1 Tax=Aegilops tauschii subsp. strangulata TaxID=200361 RepID=A0A452XJK9_AEGTS